MDKSSHISQIDTTIFPDKNNLPAGMCDALRESVLQGFHFIVERQYPSYPFINTKFDIATGMDFSESDPLRGPSVIFTWIQGRALEALTGHMRWIESLPAGKASGWYALDTYRTGLPQIIDAVIGAMESARARNGGKLPFMMRADGRSLRVVQVARQPNAMAQLLVEPASALPEAHSFSDLFYAKGLMSAGAFLQRSDLMDAAEKIFCAVVQDLENGAFYFGQEELDVKNPVRAVVDRYSHAGRMIAIGAATLFWRHTKKAIYRDLGRQYIEWILSHHVADAHTDEDLLAYDFFEYTNKAGKPWRNARGQLWSDPGHATEFAGLALAHFKETSSGNAETITRLIQVFLRNFKNGFCAKQIGIVKSFDLARREPINTDMPWWSLPESMRAAALGMRYARAMGQGDVAGELAQIFERCHRSFSTYYLQPSETPLALQCLDHRGARSMAIPAMPDADPCYHTGLSFIGCLRD